MEALDAQPWGQQGPPSAFSCWRVAWPPLVGWGACLHCPPKDVTAAWCGRGYRTGSCSYAFGGRPDILICFYRNCQKCSCLPSGWPPPLVLVGHLWQMLKETFIFLNYSTNIYWAPTAYVIRSSHWKCTCEESNIPLFMDLTIIIEETEN